MVTDLRAALTPAMEDYAKTIYKLQEAGEERVSTNGLAVEMGVAPSSVTSMMKSLARIGIVEHTRYHGVRLTIAGERVALEVIRHHRLLERYLQEFLGFGWDEVHDEADRLEHAISERLEERLAELLGNPQTDPHGEPIPTRDGAVVAQSLVPFEALGLGIRGVISRVVTSDSEKLRYLMVNGLVPGAEFEVLEIAPFGGPIRIRIGDGERSLGPTLASDLLVAELEQKHPADAAQKESHA